MKIESLLVTKTGINEVLQVKSYWKSAYEFRANGYDYTELTVRMRLKSQTSPPGIGTVNFTSVVFCYPKHSAQSGRKVGRDNGKYIPILIGKYLRHKVMSKYIYKGTDIKVDSINESDQN